MHGPPRATYKSQRTRGGSVLAAGTDHRTGAPPPTEGSGGFRTAQTRGGGRRARSSSTANPDQRASASRGARPPTSTAGGRQKGAGGGGRAQKGPIRISMQFFFFYAIFISFFQERAGKALESKMNSTNKKNQAYFSFSPQRNPPVPVYKKFTNPCARSPR